MVRLDGLRPPTGVTPVWLCARAPPKTEGELVGGSGSLERWNRGPRASRNTMGRLDSDLNGSLRKTQQSRPN